MKSSGETRSRIEEIVRTCAKANGMEVLSVAWRIHGTKTIIDIAADAPSATTLDDYAALSRSISSAIDAEDIPLERYELSVGSPGLERPLQFVWQFEKNVGRKFRFFADNGAGEATYEMRLHAVHDGIAQFVNASGAFVEFPITAVRNAVVQAEF